jgi:iron(III) transport system substrate-binding protein
MTQMSPSPQVRRRGVVVAFAVVTCVSLLAACSSGSSTSAGTTGSTGAGVTITLYSGQHEETTDALVKAFEKQTGVNVKVRNDDEDVLTQQIAQEGSRSPADVFYTENSPPLMTLEAKGLLSPIDPATLAEVPARFNSPTGHWVGVSARVSTLVYNTTALQASDLPSSVLGLADPKWEGKLGLAPSETDFQPIVTSLIHSEGKAATLAWLKAVKKNAASHTYPDNETLVSAVNKGQVQLGLINHYYWYRLRKEEGASSMHSALANFSPADPGYVLDVSGAGVMTSSRHQAEAQQFVAFLVSAQGQAILAGSDSYEYPVRTGAAASPELPPLAQLQPNPLSVAELGDGAAAVALLQEAQLL